MKIYFNRGKKYRAEFIELIIRSGWTTQEEINEIKKADHEYEQAMTGLLKKCRAEALNYKDECEKVRPTIPLYVEVDNKQRIAQILDLYGLNTLRRKKNELIDKFISMGYEYINYKWIVEGIIKYLPGGCFTPAGGLRRSLIEKSDQELSKTLDEFGDDSITEYKFYRGIQQAISWLDLITELVEYNKDRSDSFMTDLKYCVYSTMEIVLYPQAKIRPTKATVGKIKIAIPDHLLEMKVFKKDQK